MIKKSLALLSVSAIFFALSANADVMLKDESEILGKWKLTAEAAKLDGEKKKVIVDWNFKPGGILETVATDAGGRTNEMHITIKYSVENGIIKKQISPGRERFEDCKVLEKTGTEMVLKCPFLYFFLTKI